MKAKAGNLAVLALGEAATRGFSFLAFSFMGHVLGPGDFGIFGSAMAVMMFGNLALDQGFGIFGSRSIARDPQGTEALVQRCVSVQLLLATTLYGFLWVVTLLTPLDPTLVALLRGLGLSLFAAPFLLNWVFQGRNEMFWHALPNVLRQGIFCFTAWLVLSWTRNVLWLPLAEILGCFSAAALFLVLYRRLGMKLSPSLRRGFDWPLLREALPIGLSNFIWALRTYLPILVILTVLGRHDAGLFDAGHRIILVIIAGLGIYFTNVFPSMSAAARHNFPRFKSIVARALATSLALCLSAALAVQWLAPTLMKTVFGPAFATPKALVSMTALAWLLPILACRRSARSALMALDLQKRELGCSLAGLLLMVLLIVPLTSRYGLRGCVMSVLIAEFFATALTCGALLLFLRARNRETEDAC